MGPFLIHPCESHSVETVIIYFLNIQMGDGLIWNLMEY